VVAINEISGLPALLVDRPCFPGEFVEFPCKWDYEDAAVRSASTGAGLLALVPGGPDFDQLAEEARGGEMIASTGQIVGRSQQGDVRVRVGLRFKVTELQLPPLPPLARGVALGDAGVNPWELEPLALDVRTLTQVVLVDRHQEGPPQLWTAPPETLANLVAPLIFSIASPEWHAVFRLPAKAQLEMEHDWLTRQLASKPHSTDTIDEPDASPADQPSPPLSESDRVAKEFREHFAGLDPDLLVQVERRVRACVGDRDGQERDLAFIRSMPLTTRARQTRSPARAKAVLIRDLGEVDAAGEWLLERMAAQPRRPDAASVAFGRTLLLAGEAGVGKTLRAEVIAKALGLPCHTLPLAGLSEALSIRGLRSLYTRSQPGIIAEALAATQSMRCVVILDEIDKLGRGDHHGDPADALLHAVDPRQARAFRDDFLEFPLDLSEVLFIATANDPTPINRTLVDRFQLLGVDPASRLQKRHIASRIMLPALRREYQLAPRALVLTKGALEALLDRHDLEPGLRQMENSLRTLCIRAAAVLGHGTRSHSVLSSPEVRPVGGVEVLAAAPDPPDQ
jgi:hypothetical protein